MKPSLYLYKKTKNTIQLYFGEISTINGLKALNGDEKIKLISIGATMYKKYSWASKKEFPSFNTICKLTNFFNKVGDIGLIDFEMEIIGKGKMLSHDDGECSFYLNDEKYAMKILKKLTPNPKSDFIISKILENEGYYILVDEENTIKKFKTFEEYIETET